jgi:sigma-B regulation protein RsbU (phosphoserine phosphatase)
MAPASPRILLCADAAPSVEDARRLLQQAGHAVTFQPLADAPLHEAGSYDLVVVDAGRDSARAHDFCRRLRARGGDRLLPVLFLTADHRPAARLASLECGADTYLLRPFAPGELLAQVGALLRIRRHLGRLEEKTAEVHRINKRLQTAYQRTDMELELARRIQESFLPQSLPEVPQVRFAVKYRPCDRVGGDFYDVFRLDEHHLGFYIADAMGHGVPASLLTVFVKKGVRAKEIFGQGYRLVPPGDVLGHLNRDLIAQQLSEHPFITMVYVLFNFQDGTFRFARSGHPYPLYLTKGGEPALWQVPGSLLGVFNTEFREQTQQLRPGDKVLLYTDGMDAAAFENRPLGTSSLLAYAGRHGGLPVQELVDRLCVDLFGQARQTDDLTVLGIEFVG